MSGNNAITSGQQRPPNVIGDVNQISQLIQSALTKMQTATLVRVEACTNAGGLSEVGFVDVTPLVDQIDGNGIATPHATVYGIPYRRIQGGANAIIIDPEPGDIGICLFANRDLSKVKAAKRNAPPGSFRTFSFSDGMYLGGTLNATPTQYIQFNSAGITIHSPTEVTVSAPTVTVTATTATVNATSATTNASSIAKITAPDIRLGDTDQTLYGLVNSTFANLFDIHTHNVTAIGADTAVPTQLMGSGYSTTTVKGG